ncbi:helix-turn-helix domain-containing protein [Larkinella insperata]|uniref:Helix-turn-helix domain-containing protein n=1 Tax=Larkinella insperata TaxID=332158 RepID=A0ABW3Q9M8_9BACT|nr:helix-turn-helix transcriptional regulator [Larkinella insperata]
MNIAENIKAIRESKGIKQSELARALGVEPTNYPRIEKRDKRLTIEMLEKIAKALGVSVYELLDNNSNQDIVRLQELENKVLRLRTANKVLRKKNDLLYKLMSLFHRQSNLFIDEYNKRIDEDDDYMDYEEIKRQAKELGLDIEEDEV